MGRLVDANDRLIQLSGGKLGLDDWVSQMTGGGAVAEETFFNHKDARVAGAAAGAPTTIGLLVDMWRYDGCTYAGGASPGATFRNPDRTTQGALGQVDPTGGRSKYLANFVANCTTQGAILVYDRLMDVSGMSGTVTTAQNTNGGASADVTRYTDGVGNWLCLEVYTAVGATSTTATAVYKDGAGASKTTQAVPFGNVPGTSNNLLLPMSLAAGGSTVKGCTSVTVLASTGTAGDFGVTIIHPLLIVPIASGGDTAFAMSWLNGPWPQIQTGACISFAFITGNTTAPLIEYFGVNVEV